MNQVWKSGLLLGAAAAAFICSAAPRSAHAQPLPPGPADQAVGNGFYLEADVIIRDEDRHTLTAKGSVEARYQGKVLRADELDEDQATGVVTVHGHVQMLNPDGTSDFAESMTLDKNFNAGLALAFSTRQEPNVKIVADESIRLNRDAMALNKAVFTVCDLCAADGTPETPTWSIQAAQVIQDHEHNIVFYRHAVMRVKGLPIFYTPLFWHVDPAAKRGSGLLAPMIGIGAPRGTSVTLPYLWVIDPSSDLTITPQLDSRVTSLLMLDYRKRFYTGQMDVRLGYTYAQEFDSRGHTYDYDTSRSFILASGAYIPAPNWTWGWAAERVTDPLMFQRYSVPNTYDLRGLFASDDQRLLSQLYTTEQDSHSYLSAAVLSWQGLRPGDLNGTFPIAAPVIEGHYDPDYLVLGGRLRLDGSGLLLDTARNPYTDVAPGQETARATVSGDWRSSYTFYNGVRLSPFLQGRTDLYNMVNPTDLAASGAVTTYNGDHATARVLGTAGVDASWPFFRRTGDLTVVLEPLAQVAVSPRAVDNPLIPNQDSQAIVFDETTLFEANKSPGFDYYEGGARANVGGRATFRWDEGGSIQLVGGRSLRTVPDPTLPASSSLDQTESDWVVAANVQPFTGFSASTRALLDGKNEDVRRLEAGLNAGVPRLNGFVRYLYDLSNPGVNAKIETAQIGGQVLITKHWGVGGSASMDIANKAAPLQQMGLVYQDECIHFEIDWSHNGTTNRTLRPSDTILFRLLLVTLGSTGYQRPDFR